MTSDFSKMTISSFQVVCAVICSATSLYAQRGDVVSLQIEPERIVLGGNLDRVQLVVMGKTESGNSIDLTRDATYRPSDATLVTISKNGFVAPLKNGDISLEIVYQKRHRKISISVRNVVENPKISYLNDVIPILNRAGCNGGGCHGSQFGKGGFKLSLFGYAPEQDYGPLVRDRMQRRISRLNPIDSLILKKPTMKISHGGGKRFLESSFEYEILKNWISAGAPGLNRKERKVVNLHVFPEEKKYRKDERQQMRVVAVYDDGSRKDVTATAQYDSLAGGIAKVDSHGLITAASSGQAAIMIRYMGQAKVSTVMTPFKEKVDLSNFKPNNFIDEHVLAKWKTLGIVPSELCTDAEFVRRVYLDCLGTLPTPAKIRSFSNSTVKNKRKLLVDELLGLSDDPKKNIHTEEWSAYWSLKWGDLLRNNRLKVGNGGMWAFYNWLRQSLRENKPVDRFVREIITAQGSIFENGPANYFRIATSPTELAETTAQVFLGVRMQCAKCHHHPFEVYSQADYYGMAAFFTRVTTKRSVEFGELGGDFVVMLRSTGAIRHPRTRKIVPPTFLGEKPLQKMTDRDLRQPLAKWITSPQNKFFARNFANRFWGYYMGSALVESIDDMRATNPPSNPELLDALADYLVQNKFDLKQLMRAIMNSRVYQLSSKPRPENRQDRRFYTHYNVKRLPAEVLLDSINFACGTQERFPGVPIGTRAIELPDSNYTSYFLETMGRPKRVIACECERTAEPNLAQVLHVANGEVVNRKVADAKGRIAKLLKAKTQDRKIIDDLYLVTFSRPPTKDEQAHCKTILENSKNRKEGFEDILWALLNSREFLFNH